MSSLWHREGGYKEFFGIAFPLILSTGTWSVQHFINRMFLTWYSQDAIAASMPAGMVNFTIICIFLGTVSYADVFVAQYYGAGRYEKIGPSVWHGVYVALMGSAVITLMIPFAGEIFSFIGHPQAVMKEETTYFRMLCLSAFPQLASAAISTFYAGRGKTWVLVAVNSIGMCVNIVFDYLLIFGNGPFPELGIKGAGIASLLASLTMFAVYLFLFRRKAYEEQFKTRSGWKLDPEFLRRFLKFGLPSGAHFFLDIAGFTVFILIMGTLGTVPLAATNIAFNISTLAFMPMIGCGIAVSVLTGQYLGKNAPEIASRSVWTGFSVTFVYMFLFSLLYVLTPSLFTASFALKADPEAFSQTSSLVVVLLRFVAVYSLFDAMNIIFSSALKGAGDTRFVMNTSVLGSVLVLVIPSYIVLHVMGEGLYAGWVIASAYIGLLGLSFFFRFLGGKWKEMRVIEHGEATPSVVTFNLPESPEF
jgi:MATE family multidrug resistance protein